MGLIRVPQPSPSLALRVAVARAIAAAHGLSSDTSTTQMRAALRRIVKILDGESA